MKSANYIDLLLIYLLFSIQFLKISNAQVCNTTECAKSFVSIKFPFRLKDTQHKSCGAPGFDLHCNQSTTLFELPKAGFFAVDSITYISREIKLLDPNNCLPKRLLSFDLTNSKTAFRPPADSPSFSLYNCSGDHYPALQKIICLSGSDYSVVSGSAGEGIDVTKYSNCTFVRNVSLPTTLGSSFTHLPYARKMTLFWDEQKCNSKACGRPEPESPAKKAARDAIISVVVILVFLCFCCYCCKPKQYWVLIKR